MWSMCESPLKSESSWKPSKKYFFHRWHSSGCFLLCPLPVVQSEQMEEAYAQLYQEFVRLRSLCLRQASLLRQLTAELKQQQGETNGDLRDITSLPGQLDSEYPVYLNSAAPHHPPVLSTAAPCGVQGPSGNSGNFSDLLAQDVSRLTVDSAAAQRKDPKAELSVPQSLTSHMTLFHGDFTDGKQHLSQNGGSERSEQMEEAYAQLYQEFVRLRSLCLRQASLLRQLTAELKQQQGETNGDLRDITSLPGQLDSEYPVYLNSVAPPHPPVVSTAASCGVQGPSGNSGTFSDLLAQDVSRLTVDSAAAQRKDPKAELSVPQSLTSHMTLFHDFNDGKQHLSQNEGSERLPALSCSLLGPDVLSQTNGDLVSDVALQSHVCDFCQAVFPGDTTTRGQYLQHLYTHIS